MERALRCTVCAWCGAFAEGVGAEPVSPRSLPHPFCDMQALYERKQLAGVRFGVTREPPCPKCGHHTVSWRTAPSFHPAM